MQDLRYADPTWEYRCWLVAISTLVSITTGSVVGLYVIPHPAIAIPAAVFGFTVAGLLWALERGDRS